MEIDGPRVIATLSAIIDGLAPRTEFSALPEILALIELHNDLLDQSRDKRDE